MELIRVYDQLFELYGRQNWWPVICDDKEDYQFEIVVGAILTQNTSWKNVEKAILNLDNIGLLNAKRILESDEKEIIGLIKPAGYYNQKARKLKEISKFYLSLNGKTPNRESLLNVWGIGKETADSILLYAYSLPIFVIDAYTKRMFSCLTRKDLGNYDSWQEFFHENLPMDVQLFNEFHALIVEHCKKVCVKSRKFCDGCFLNKNVN